MYPVTSDTVWYEVHFPNKPIVDSIQLHHEFSLDSMEWIRKLEDKDVSSSKFNGELNHRPRRSLANQVSATQPRPWRAGGGFLTSCGTTEGHRLGAVVAKRCIDGLPVTSVCRPLHFPYLTFYFYLLFSEIIISLFFFLIDFSEIFIEYILTRRAGVKVGDHYYSITSRFLRNLDYWNTIVLLSCVVDFMVPLAINLIFPCSNNVHRMCDPSIMEGCPQKDELRGGLIVTANKGLPRMVKIFKKVNYSGTIIIGRHEASSFHGLPKIALTIFTYEEPS